MPTRERPHSPGGADQTIVSNVEVKTQWRGQPATRKRRISALLRQSVATHSVRTPRAALLGLLRANGHTEPPPTEDPPPITALPIQLIEDAPPAPVNTDPEPEEEPAAAVIVQPSPPQMAAPHGSDPVPEPEPKPAEEQAGDGIDQAEKDR